MPNFPCGHWQYRKPRRTKYEHSAALAVLPPEAGGKAPHLGYDARHTQASGSSTGTQKNTHGSSGPATQARNMTTTKLKAAAFAPAAFTAAGASATELLNSSYDVARELFAALNPGLHRPVGQGASGRQTHDPSVARGVLDSRGQGASHSQKPADAACKQQLPFYSTTAFLVRRGNPKGVHDWSDLARSAVFPEPLSPAITFMPG